jgi:hypothetical protein
MTVARLDSTLRKTDAAARIDSTLTLENGEAA